MTKPRVRITTGGEIRGVSVAPSRAAAYMRGEASPFFFNWNPVLREQRDDVHASYQKAAARAIDAIHNSGWLAGAIDQSIASTIGVGLRLASRPDREALGWSTEQAEKWSETVERRWSMWSENPIECDAAGKMSVGQMQDAVLRAYYSHGEALALLPFIRRSISMTGTKVKLLPPTRLVQDSDHFSRLMQGVRIDQHGLPISYRVSISSQEDPFAFGARSVDIRARDGAGRPQVLHVFDGSEGQMRGITPLVPALRTVRQYDQLSDVTLQTALIQAIFAATYESAAPTEEVLRALQSADEQKTSDPMVADYLGARAAWYQNTKIDMSGAARIAHLFPGDKLEFQRSEHSNGTYEPLAKFLLREIARCLGMSVEDFTGDFNGVTYTGARLGTSANWPVVLRRRANIPARFVQAVYEAWLEEEIEAGTIPFPGGLMVFLANRPAAVVANWRGPAKPQADDLKTAKAHEVYKRLGVISDEQIADDLGWDIVDVYEQRAKEKKLREKLDLPEGDTLAPDPVADALIKEAA